VYHSGSAHLLVESFDAVDIDPARRRLRNVGVVGQPEVDLHAVACTDGVVGVLSHRLESDLVGIEPLSRLKVERRKHWDRSLQRAPGRIGVARIGHGRRLLGVGELRDVSRRRRLSATSASSATRHASIRPDVGVWRKAAISVSEMPARRSTPMRVAPGICDGW